MDIESLWRALLPYAGLFAVIWGALWSFMRWALPPKLRELVLQITKPTTDKLEEMLDEKASISDVMAMEKRFEDRTRPYLDAIERNTKSAADSLTGVNEKLGDLAERVSFMEGAWDGTDRRRADRRHTD